MEFISVQYLLFVPAVFGIYWLAAKKVAWQNFILVVASYLFYGWWDWRFMWLMGGYSLVAYGSGWWMSKIAATAPRRVLLTAVVLVNLGVLAFFKYYNFFALNMAKVFGAFGFEADWATLNIILPVGISFYTFQALSYVIDIYRRRITPTRNIFAFLCYVSFFPQLIAGPIERAETLLPQFLEPRRFRYADGVAGMKRILWGCFKKMVIADNCAIIADHAFNYEYGVDRWQLWVGAFCFSIQIYCDFSGYCDIAIGTARLFGIELMENFRLPYYARNIKEFWQRWHVSLNLWFRDYVYIPLGGSRKGLAITCFNILIVFALSGLWHGAAWHFIAWGLFNGGLIVLFIIAMRLLRRNASANPLDALERSTYKSGTTPSGHSAATSRHKVLSAKALTATLCTFFLTMNGWVFFRAEWVPYGLHYLGGMYGLDERTPVFQPHYLTWIVMTYIAVFLIAEFSGRGREHGFDFPHRGIFRFTAVRWGAYLTIAIATFLLGDSSRTFIYFQF